MRFTRHDLAVIAYLDACTLYHLACEHGAPRRERILYEIEMLEASMVAFPFTVEELQQLLKEN